MYPYDTLLCDAEISGRVQSRCDRRLLLGTIIPSHHWSHIFQSTPQYHTFDLEEQITPEIRNVKVILGTKNILTWELFLQYL